MATKLIFNDDSNDGSVHELEVFADNDDMITVSMQNPNDDYVYCVIQLNKESALILLKTLTEEIKKI